ncbi:MAG TPA: efflux RND transporter periplasmic adaptor subunit [Gemmatimonadaceae bacterium]|nr:efflux RND transporter periplasmic adaptor subunit [Gemmatimonadaceae bacterium]
MASRTRAITIGAILTVLVITVVILTRPGQLVLTGIVTTNDVIVSPQVSAQLSKLLVKEGDTVQANQLIAVLSPDELRADQAFAAQSERGLGNQVEVSEASLRYQEKQTADQIKQAEANEAAAVAQQQEAAANLSIAKLAMTRADAMLKAGAISTQDHDQARTNMAVAAARVDATSKQVESARAALSLAQSAAEQVAVRRGSLAAAEREQAAARAQTTKADVRLSYSEIRAPIAGIVDVEAARAGEVVSPGQPIITLINPDDLWIRADVEESYIDRIKLGDSLTVRLPSGDTRRGAVFYRGVDAGFATQRDVSRTKRDIKTFEIRIRVNNKDRSLATGMTAYVLLPKSVTSH